MYCNTMLWYSSMGISSPVLLSTNCFLTAAYLVAIVMQLFKFIAQLVVMFTRPVDKAPKDFPILDFGFLNGVLYVPSSKTSPYLFNSASRGIRY